MNWNCPEHTVVHSVIIFKDAGGFPLKKIRQIFFMSVNSANSAKVTSLKHVCYQMNGQWPSLWCMAASMTERDKYTSWCMIIYCQAGPYFPRDLSFFDWCHSKLSDQETPKIRWTGNNIAPHHALRRCNLYYSKWDLYRDFMRANCNYHVTLTDLNVNCIFHGHDFLIYPTGDISFPSLPCEIYKKHPRIPLKIQYLWMWAHAVGTRYEDPHKKYQI